MTDAPDPGALAARASGGDDAGGAADAAADAATDAAADSEAGLLDLLLSTEPAETPAEDYPDLPEYTAHLVIGVKKVLNELTAGEVSTGTPAAVNFGMAGVTFARARDDGDGGDDGADAAGSTRAGAWGAT